MPARTRMPSRGGKLQHALRLDERDDALEAFAGLEVRKYERPRTAHALRVAVHYFQRRPDHRREVDLVDDEEVALGDARPALTRNLVAGRHIDDVQREVGKLGAEGGGQVVAARFDQNQVEAREAPVQALHRLEVDGSVFADRGMRT